MAWSPAWAAYWAAGIEPPTGAAAAEWKARRATSTAEVDRDSSSDLRILPWTWTPRCRATRRSTARRTTSWVNW